jgi:hypothetical protein
MLSLAPGRPAWWPEVKRCPGPPGWRDCHPELVLDAQQQFRQLKAADAQIVESAVEGHRWRLGMRVNLGDEAAH